MLLAPEDAMSSRVIAQSAAPTSESDCSLFAAKVALMFIGSSGARSLISLVVGRCGDR